MASGSNTSNICSGKILDAQAREIVFNVYNFLNNEKENLNIISLKCLNEMTVRATGVSLSSVKKIIIEGKCSSEDNNGEPLFKSPSRKRSRKCSVTSLCDFEKNDIRNIIYNFHKTEGVTPTLKMITEKIKTDLGFSGGRTSVHTIVRDLGFRWRKSENNRKLLIEKSDIRAKRINYLLKMKQFRDEKRPIVYLDEAYIHANHTQPKAWSDATTSGLKAT